MMSENETVLVGRDGWLFLVGGRNGVLQQYQTGGLSLDSLAYWQRLHEERLQRCEALGSLYFNLVVPEKIAIYENYLDGIQIDIEASPSLQIARTLENSSARDCHIDLFRVFRDQRDNVQLYLRTDTHWTFAGCYLAYETVCRKIGISPWAYLAAKDTRSTEVLIGDLGIKLDPQQEEMADRWRYERVSRMVYANPLVRYFEAAGAIQGSGTSSHTVYRTDKTDADPRTIVVFGDSYTSHVYMEDIGRLIGFLSETFREVHFIWANTIDYEYVSRVRPDIVLTEIAERFMIELPLMEFNLAEYERSQFEWKVGSANKI